ncbi:MAG: LacI family DNA-binding transcriptional regulator [Pseudomonadota bacterium]
MVTSLDVARRAGVSQSAVSRAFTPGASVSSETRAKVLTAARDLGYRPNVVARTLITGRSRMIGLVVAYLDNQYYPMALEKLCNRLQRQGYHVLVFMAAQSSVDVDEVLTEILDYQVDGIVMASVAMSSELAGRCDEAGVPVVLFNRVQDDDRFSAVSSDNAAGGAELARFLVAGGHTRIAYVAGWEGASTQRDREAGFRSGLAQCGVELVDRAVGDYDFAGAAAATRSLFHRARHPDAVFVANDHMAIAAMDVLRFELGLSVPEDVSVVGYDDAPPAAWPSYALTTVRQPTEPMVDAVVDALMARIEDDDPRPRRGVFAGELVVRRSARLPEGWSDAGV